MLVLEGTLFGMAFKGRGKNPQFSGVHQFKTNPHGYEIRDPLDISWGKQMATNHFSGGSNPENSPVGHMGLQGVHLNPARPSLRSPGGPRLRAVPAVQGLPAKIHVWTPRHKLPLGL